MLSVYNTILQLTEVTTNSDTNLEKVSFCNLCIHVCNKDIEISMLSNCM